MAAQTFLRRVRPRPSETIQNPSNAFLNELQQMAEAELAQRAHELRAHALRGKREARGQAHLCEAELRRRRGAVPVHDYRHLDLRPLEAKAGRSPWWAFWRNVQRP